MHSVSMNSSKTAVTAYKRADSPEQKKDRRLMILKAAEEELDHLRSADDFTIDSLARRIGLSRGTIYLYFKDRDAIFFVLLLDKSNRFLGEIEEHFSRLSAPVTPLKMAQAYCDALKQDKQLRHLPQLLKSLSSGPGDKTKNLDKKIKYQHADETIVRLLPGLRPDDGRKIMHFGWSMLLGFSEIIGSPTKTGIPEYVLQQVEDGLTLIIEGLLARSK